MKMHYIQSASSKTLCGLHAGAPETGETQPATSHAPDVMCPSCVAAMVEAQIHWPAVTLADYILDFLKEHNDCELGDVFDNMSVRDARGLRTALIMILHFGGKPPNWVR